jgi:hypothetical protein
VNNGSLTDRHRGNREARTESARGGQVIRSWDRMKDRAGLWVLAGSATDAVSYE